MDNRFDVYVINNFEGSRIQFVLNMEFGRTRNVLKKNRRFINCILYIILLIFFMYFYLMDEILNYTKGGTTLSSRTEEVEFLKAPYMMLCFHPSFKPSMLQKHGLPEYTVHFKDI